MIFFIKLFTTPLLIGLSLIASKKWGTIVGAAIAGLPFISGPGSVFLCLENGPDFAAHAGFSSLFGMVSSCIYCVVYAWLSRRMHFAASLILSLGAFGISATLFKLLAGPSLFWIPFSLVAPLLCTRLIPATPKAERLPAGPAWKIPAQMICGGVAVLVITGISNILGEFWSGVFLTFPIISSILIPFAHAMHGADVAIDTIHGLLIGLTGTAVFNVIIAEFLTTDFVWACYALAFSASMVVGCLFALRSIFRKRKIA